MKVEQRILQSTENATKEIGFYLSGIEKVRAQVRAAAADLTVEELARRVVPGTHQIGNLLLHLGEAEASWIHQTVAERELSDEEKWFAHFCDTTERDYAEKNYSAAECLERIDEISRRSREILARFCDEDLERFFGFERDGKRFEASLRWILIHLIEHEATHKGQITRLKRLMRESQDSI
jgi:uncharacterized damage-inducible protein DinB